FMPCVNSCCRLLFFFSSRRRHTIFSRDWSSDVCSSDLFAVVVGLLLWINLSARVVLYAAAWTATAMLGPPPTPTPAPWPVLPPRSEERRVGKECGARRCRERCRKG